MARRLPKTLIDYLVIAISPALIMTLIGSLVFFLIEICYRGGFEGRLQYIFALFVFAAVLVGRIAIEEGRQHAQWFAVPLAVATFFVLQRFVEYQGAAFSGLSWIINATLIALILWCADKLTWDCTLIDETQRDSGQGLLQLVGWDKPKATAAQDDVEQRQDLDPEGTTSRDKSPPGWRARWVRRQRRPHAPGVWVVYFSLAALPLFGVGQLFAPSGSLVDRQYCFHLLLIYVASGLGLLLTTSFLGLRRYLRQRRVEMPATMANVWLVIGAILIVALLVFAALLPRPNAEYAVSRLPFTIGSPLQEPSRYSVGDSGVKADEGELSSDKVEREKADRESQSSSARRNGEDGEGAGEQDGNGQPKSRPPRGEGHSSSGEEQKQGEPRKDPNADSQARPQDNSQSQQHSSSRDADDRDTDDEARAEKAEAGSADDSARRPSRPSSAQPDGQPAFKPQNSIRSVGRGVAALLKWVFYIAIVLLGIYCLWRWRAELMAGLRDLLRGWREFWRNLLGGRRTRTGRAAVADDGPKQALPRPFAAFSDPFAAGTADRYSPDELVRYTFQALEAWAREHGCPRQPNETPHEFARAIAVRVAYLSRDVRCLADLYCQVAYAPARLPERSDGPPVGGLSAASVDPLKELWQSLGAETATTAAAAGR